MNQIKVFGLPAKTGRWLLIPLGLSVLLCLGTVYSWSIFRKPLEKALNINATESLLPFTVLLVVFALVMPIAGFLIDRFGAKVVTAVGGVITGLGYILSGFASNTNITTLTFTYGIIAGIGVGIAYGVPLAVVAKWFPDRKGLAVGLTVVGFGLSPLITAPVAQSLISSQGISQAFIKLGIAFIAIVLVISLFLQTPPPGWQPTIRTEGGFTPVPLNRQDNQILDLVNSPSFWGLWVCYTIGTFAGLAAIGISNPLAQEIVKLDKATAAIAVSVFAIFNGLGRPFFGWLTDRTSPKFAAIVAYMIVIVASIIMLNTGEGGVTNYLVAFAMFWFSLGGWLAIAPTATLKLFPPENYAKNYGIVFTAYGAGAIAGTILAGRIRDIFGSYTAFFYPTAALAALGIVLAIFTLKRLPANQAILESKTETRF